MRRPSLKSVVCTGAALSVGISGCSTSRYGGRSFAATCICALCCPGTAYELYSHAQRTLLHATGFVTCRMSASTPRARSSEVSWNMTGVPSEVCNISICITWWQCALLQKTEETSSALLWPGSLHKQNCCVSTLEPAASALRSAASVFSGASLPPALWDTTRGLPGMASFQGAGSLLDILRGAEI
jgi:hypothetical protein